MILSTSLVHVLYDAFDALSVCHVAHRHLGKDFLLLGLVITVRALLALLVVIVASLDVEQCHS